MIGRAVRSAALLDSERGAMYEVLSRHFEGVEPGQFRKDLDEKNWVILLEEFLGQISGFSTLLLYETEHDGERLSVVYSGDTIVDRAAWGSSALPRATLEATKLPWSLRCGLSLALRSCGACGGSAC